MCSHSNYIRYTRLHINCQINILLFQKRLEGTKVTVESFLAWKAEFDAERLSKKEIVDASAKRLTGKELFLKNVTLNDSDIQFLNEGKNIVKYHLYNLKIKRGG